MFDEVDKPTNAHQERDSAESDEKQGASPAHTPYSFRCSIMILLLQPWPIARPETQGIHQCSENGDQVVYYVTHGSCASNAD